MNQVVVAILPTPEKDETLVVSENTAVILQNSPKAPLLFPVDLVLHNLENEHFLNKFSISTIDQLIEGDDVSLMFYDASPTKNGRFNMTSLILAFSALFEMTDYEIYLTLIEYQNDKQVDLISSQIHQEYRADTIDLAIKYYEFGLDNHTKGNVSIFSIILKYQSSPNAQINLIDLSGCGQDTRQQFLLSDAPWTHIYNQSATQTCLICVHPCDPIDQLQQTLTFAHQIHQTNNKIIPVKSTSISFSTAKEDRRMILNQVKNNSLVSNSSSLSSLDMRHFSHTSTSTSHTAHHDDIPPEDLEQTLTRFKQLEYQLDQMQRTQEQLVEINDKQAQLLQFLETEHYQRQQDMKQLALERQELDMLVQVFEQRIQKSDQDTARALEELEFIRQHPPATDMYRTATLESRIKELEAWQHTYTLQTAAMEKKWHDELDLHRQTLRSGDKSGLISALEARIHSLHVEKRTQQTDFEAALRDASEKTKELQKEATHQHKLNTKRKSMDQTQWLTWLEQAQTAEEVAATLAEMSLENAQLAVCVEDLESQMLHQRHRLSHQVKLLECDVVNLTVTNHQLERALDQHSQQCSSPRENVVTPLPLESNHRRKSRGSTNSSSFKKTRDRTSSIGSDGASHSSLKRCTTPNIPPPPSNPPNQPLPPVPSSQQHTIAQLEAKISTYESKVTVLTRELAQERELKQRAEKAQHILEKRLEESHTQKNKFRCF